MLEAISRERLLETLKTREDIGCSDLLIVEFSDSVVVCISDQFIHQSIQFRESHIPINCDNIYSQGPPYIQINTASYLAGSVK
jgi:hypothetical protein